MHRRLALRIALTALAAAAALPGAAHAQGSAPFKIGFILPMTGQQASTGKQIEAAIKLWQAQNGTDVAGRKVEVILKDDAGVRRHDAADRAGDGRQRQGRRARRLRPDADRRWRPRRSRRRARRRWSSPRRRRRSSRRSRPTSSAPASRCRRRRCRSPTGRPRTASRRSSPSSPTTAPGSMPRSSSRASSSSTAARPSARSARRCAAPTSRPSCRRSPT